MSLATLQRAFQAHVVAGDPAVTDDVTLAGRRGLPVYAHAYRATLRDALRDTYARTALWLGDEAFDDAADRYVAETPSFSWTLGAYGHDFQNFLEREYRGDPEVAELAWLEGALRAAFAAADPGTPGDLSAVDWDRAVLRFAPSVAARQVTTDVAAIWHALGDERAPDDYALAAPIGLVVWREGLSPQFRTADPREAALIDVLIGGARFADGCATIADATPDLIGGWLAAWLRGGLIDAIEAG
jgi:hypothetical protein